MIKFICYSKKGKKVDYYTCADRKEAIKLIHNIPFIKYKNIVVNVNNEQFNFNSFRGQQYFGYK